VKRIKQTLMVIMFTFLVISMTACATESQTRTSMNIRHTTLWQLIETLIDQPSLAPDKIRQVLPVEFSEHNNNRYFSFYKGESLGLDDQIEIKMIDLRVKHTDETDGMVGLLGISRAVCITVTEVRTHYPDLMPVPPRGHMLVDADFYSVRKPWGLLTFGFADRAHPCLASVVLDRTPPPAPSTPAPSSP